MAEPLTHEHVYCSACEAKGQLVVRQNIGDRSLCPECDSKSWPSLPAEALRRFLRAERREKRKQPMEDLPEARRVSWYLSTTGQIMWLCKWLRIDDPLDKVAAGYVLARVGRRVALFRMAEGK